MDTESERLVDDPAHGLGPTRARVLALLQDAGEPMTAAAAAARMGLHVNTARFHLDALTADGLVVREREERSTPGRPKMMYAAASSAPGVAGRSYRLLAEILTSYLADRLPDPAASAEEAGHAWGRFLTEPARPFAAPDAEQALDALVDGLGRVGFESHVVDERGSLRLEVSHCPFLEVAEGHNDVVCSVHLGLMKGMLEQMGAPVRAEDLEPLVEPSLCIARLAR
ncbi:MAG TPA: helix-turn-helix domain-containing protein [Nocardioidaceae bacterium]